MRILVNGELQDCLGNESPREFLDSLGIAPKDALIVLNSEALSEEELDVKFEEGDRLEILQFAGGG